MSVKFPFFWGGGGCWGGECRFYFYGRADFLTLVHTFSWGNSYGPMVLKFLQKFPPTLVLVHGWLSPASFEIGPGCGALSLVIALSFSRKR